VAIEIPIGNVERTGEEAPKNILNPDPTVYMRPPAGGVNGREPK